MTVFYNNHRDQWSYNFRCHGQRYQGYCIHAKTGLPAKNKTEAKAIEAIIKGKAKSGEQKKAEPVPVAGFAFAEPLAFYLKKLQGKPSFKLAQTYARELLEWFGPATDMADIDEAAVAEYATWCKTQTRKTYVGKDANGHPLFKDTGRIRSPRTVNGYLSMIERSYNAFRLAPESKPMRHLIPPPPEIEYMALPKRTPTPIPQGVSREILEKTTLRHNSHIRLAHVLCLHTGMRDRECAQLMTRQYMEAEGRIMLTPDQTKTDTGRTIPINPVARQVINECLRLGDMLWDELRKDPDLAAEYAEKFAIQARGDIPLILYRANGTGLPRPVKRLANSAWKRLKKETGSNYRWHDSRASFCTEALAAGTDLKTVKELAGHQSIATTELYLDVANPQKQSAVDALARQNPTPVESLTIVAYNNRRKKKNAA